MSYSWLLERLRDIFGSAQTPNVIVTDRDGDLSAVIRDVFPCKKVILINYCRSIC